MGCLVHLSRASWTPGYPLPFHPCAAAAFRRASYPIPALDKILHIHRHHGIIDTLLQAGIKPELTLTRLALGDISNGANVAALLDESDAQFRIEICAVF